MNLDKKDKKNDQGTYYKKKKEDKLNTYDQ